MLKFTGAVSFLFFFAACTNGGSITIQPGAVKVRNPGSPYVTITSGGESLVIQNGKTATTGVHGWVSLQPVSAKDLSSTSGVRAVIHEQQNTPHPSP